MASRSPRTRALYRRLAADVSALRLASGPATEEPVTEAQLKGLPETAQRYLRFMRVVGRPADWSFLLHVTGKFRLRPGLPWMRCEAWQYNSGLSVARFFHMRIDAAGVLPMIGRDAYAGGRGRMLGKLAGLVTVADGAGPETDVSELITYLNDAVFWAPSMLLAPAVGWAPVDDRSFEVTLEDSGHRVTARVFVDERGAPVNFSTEDRWCDLPGGPVRMRWSTPVTGWLREQPPEQPWDAVWSFHVLPLGACRCRLVSRARSVPVRGAGRLAALVMEPVTVVMTRKMLLGIKRRAERHVRADGERQVQAA